MKTINKVIPRRRSLSVAAGTIILFSFLWGCGGVTTLPRMDEVDRGKSYPHVQVFPNYGFFPECNRDFCAVLFTEGNAGLYVPRVESLGSGKPASFNLRLLRPYMVSDGSVLFAPLGSAPTEYRTESGQIRIQFSFMPGRENFVPRLGTAE